MNEKNGTTVYLRNADAADGKHGPEWLDAIRENEAQLKAFADLLPEPLGRAIFDLSNTVVVHFKEVDAFGEWGIITISKGTDGYITKKLTVLTPSSYYSSQTITLYESNRDTRVKELEESFYARVAQYRDEHPGIDNTEAWENVKPVVVEELADLARTIWQEQVDSI